MQRLAIFCLLLALVFSASRAELPYDVKTLPSPAGAGALSPALAKAPDGTIWLSWLEPSANGITALRYATLDLSEKKWRAAQTIASGRDWMVKSSDIPTLNFGPDGRMTAVWFVVSGAAPAPAPATGAAAHAHGTSTGGHHGPAYHVVYSRSTDAGKTWSAPAPVTRESDAVEFLSLVTLADGQVLAVWLDGRGKKNGGNVQQLFARILGSTDADTLVDASVCDCCPTSLIAFPDGSALLGYRGRTPEEIRDILTARYVDGRWESARPSTGDHWKIVGCPVNGPRLASDGPRVLKVWFTASANEPRVMVSSSANAGGLYTMAQRADIGGAIGRLDASLLRDGTQLVTWVAPPTKAAGSTAAFYLRRYGPAGGTQSPVLLAALKDAPGAGYPRIAVAKDFDNTPAQLVAAFTRTGEQTTVETLLVTMPEADLLAEVDAACGCAPQGEAVRGYAIRGSVISAAPETGIVRLRHEAIPGLIRAGETDFKVAANVFHGVKAGQEILARTERKTGEWQIFDVRLLVRNSP